VYLQAVAGVTPTLRVSTPDANVNMNLRTKGTGVVQINSIEAATTTGVQIFRNKRIEPRVVTAVNSISITPALNTGDIYEMTALASALNMLAPVGTTQSGQELLFRIRDNGTARAITWNAVYRPIGVTLPVTTVAGKWLYVRTIYNPTDTKWDVIDVRQEA
jgi:hypothetical protein